MKIKNLIIILMVLFHTIAQSAVQKSELTQNYEGVWRANIDDLRNDYIYIDDDLYSMFLKDTKQKHAALNNKPISFEGINKPVPDKFVRASEHLDMREFDKYSFENDTDAITYILKDRLEQVKSGNKLPCEYKIRFAPDNESDQYFHSLRGLKEPYVKFMTDRGHKVSTFIETNKLLGTTRLRDGYHAGAMKVLIKGRVVSLSTFECSKAQGAEQITKDLTEWGELLIKANE